MQIHKNIPCALAITMAAILGAAPVHAQKQSDKPAAKAEAAPASGASASYGVKLGGFFNDQQKSAARKVFAQKFAKGKTCPEGLEKNAKGICDSPWDSRYWVVGQALQPAVKPHPVPDPLKAALPPAPKGYEYVLVADDILLISSGTKLVVDMIEDLAG